MLCNACLLVRINVTKTEGQAEVIINKVATSLWGGELPGVSSTEAMTKMVPSSKGWELPYASSRKEKTEANFGISWLKLRERGELLVIIKVLFWLKLLADFFPLSSVTKLPATTSEEAGVTRYILNALLVSVLCQTPLHESTRKICCVRAIGLASSFGDVSRSVRGFGFVLAYFRFQRFRPDLSFLLSVATSFLGIFDVLAIVCEICCVGDSFKQISCAYY
ncbi:pentatricopeptide repeat-containing protein [Dorcoceras hygrometricum]|uniref:Pentatricopeptide repeat-containing protein n=1 Tax=Dorcoceras hygrometricum TaxID=472368 RepID=A0A2Z7DC64_9LAMI|nr:pentatricopeptide repeat-containing protein [Dorcoceras hygrometricum]